MSPSLAPVNQREGWVDAAKAVTIVLIVLYHVSVVSVNVLVAERGAISTAISEFSRILGFVRIPLFFLVAGFLAHRAVSRPLRHTVRTKVIDLLWVFVVWSIAFAIPYGIYASPTDRSAGILQNLSTIPQGGTAYWFLFALPVFFLLGKLFSRTPVTLVVVAALLYVFSPGIQSWITEWLGASAGTSARRLSGFLIFYAIGLAAPGAVRWLANRGWYVGIAAAASFIVLYLVTTSTPPAFTMVRSFLLTLFGVIALLILSRVIALVPGMQRLFIAIASATLAIYVTHSLILYSLYASTAMSGQPVLPASVIVDAIYTPIMTMTLVGLGVAFAMLVRRSGISGVLDAPLRPGRHAHRLS